MMLNLRLCLVVFGLTLALPIAAQAATHEVTVGNNFFSPNDLTIQVGDAVRWTNSSGFHDVTADDGSWASETSNSFVYERTFNTVEEVLYYCTVHSAPGRNIDTSMNGRINVVEADPAFQINPAISDAWFDPLTSGQGFFIIVWEEQMFLSWFTYDTERPPTDATAILGEPGHRWITAQGSFSSNVATLDATLTSGGVFDSPLPGVENDPYGTVTVTFDGCNAATVAYDFPDPGVSGSVSVQRIVLDNVALCEALQEGGEAW